MIVPEWSHSEIELCGHKASAQPVTRLNRLSAIRLTDNYLSGTSTHW
jgi:hypothetical protein